MELFGIWNIKCQFFLFRYLPVWELLPPKLRQNSSKDCQNCFFFHVKLHVSEQKNVQDACGAFQMTDTKELCLILTRIFFV